MVRGCVRAGLALAVIVLIGCGSDGDGNAVERASASSGAPSATAPAPADPAELCRTLEQAGIAQGCERTLPGGISARARLRYDFDLVSVPGKGGSVLSFETADDYEATVSAYAEVAVLAGPHRYGNRDRLVFVQLNEGAPLDVGDRVRSIVEGL